MAREEKRKLRGKLFHQLSFAARVTHCGSNAPKHTRTRGQTYTGRIHNILQQVLRQTPNYFTDAVAAANVLHSVCVAGLAPCWATCRECVRYHSHWGFTMYDSPDKLLARPGLLWTGLVWPVQNC